MMMLVGTLIKLVSLFIGKVDGGSAGQHALHEALTSC